MQLHNEIYTFIKTNIEDIESELALPSNKELLDRAKQSVLEIIKDFRKNIIDQAIEELKKNQEWDVFTIAFYGETNAGKSTIIETLRIYFQEETKMEVQKKFQKILHDFNIKMEHFENESSVAKYSIEKYDKNYKTMICDFKAQTDRLNTQILNMQKIDSEKRKNSIFHRFISFLNLNPLVKEIDSLKLFFSSAQRKFQDEEIDLKKAKELEEKKLETLKIQLQQYKDLHIPQLTELSDGQIIGDGRSDFTQETIQYIFTYNDQKFAFLDVPGIEGKESVVIDEIASAVKKAHAVFYVTSHYKPPETGDNNKKGTLEKIKEHLGSQTEVYTIYNERIKSPRKLEILEYPSLEELDTKLKEVLGANYIGHKKLSARVSFLALAECLAPTLKTREEKNKFLNKFSKDDLLEKALLTDFTNFITNDLIQNTKGKIKKSNFNKANEVLKELIALLASVSKKNFEPIYKQLSKELKDATSNLNDTLSATKNRMKNQVITILEQFKYETRDDIYARIKENISDDEFKHELKLVITRGQDDLVGKLSNILEAEFNKFQENIDEVIGNFNRRGNNVIQEFRTISFDTNSSSFRSDIKLGNPIDVMGLMGSLATTGAATYFAVMAVNGWNPVGWTMAVWIAAIGVVTGLIGIGKSIYKVFNAGYKKEEQKNYASKYINSIAENIIEKILEKLDLPFSEFEKITKDIISNLESGVEQVKKTNDYILASNDKLMQLSKNIQIEGDK